MTALIAILTALNLIAGSVALPIFVAGMGAGAGALGSSYGQKADLQNDDQAKAALAIFKESCDQNRWTSQTAFPQTPQDIKTLSAQVKAGQAQITCQPRKKDDKRYKGIIFKGPDEDIKVKSPFSRNGNQQEMELLLKEQWDARTLLAVYFLLQRGFNAQNGFKIKCENNKLSAPKMILGVHFDDFGSYIDQNGRPRKASYYKTFPLDTVPEGDADQNRGTSISPHAYGQAVDVYSFGCVEIVKDNVITKEVLEIAPNMVVKGQERQPDNSHINITDTTDGQDRAKNALPVLSPQIDNVFDLGLQQSFELFPDATSIQTVLENLDLTADPLAILGVDKAENLPAQLAVSSIEKKLGAKGQIFSNMTNLEKMGRSVIAAKLKVPDGQTAGDVFWQNVNKKIASLKLTDPDLNLPAGTLDKIKGANYAEAAKIFATHYVNQKFSLGLDSVGLNAIIGANQIDFNLVENSELLATLNSREKEILRLISQQGLEGVSQYIAKLDLSRFGPNEALLSTLKHTAPEKVSALVEFLASSEDERTNIIEKYKNSPDSDSNVLNWMRENIDLPETLSDAAQEIVQGFKNGGSAYLKNMQISGSAVLTEAALMTLLDNDDRQLIYDTLGTTQPTASQIKEAITSGRFSATLAQIKTAKLLQDAGLGAENATLIVQSLLQVGKSVIGGNGLQIDLGSYNLNKKEGREGLAKEIFYAEVGAKTGVDSSQVKQILTAGTKEEKEALYKKIATAHGVSPEIFDKAVNRDLVGVGIEVAAQNLASIFGAEQATIFSDALKNYRQSKDFGQAFQSAGGSFLKSKNVSDADTTQILSGNFQNIHIIAPAAYLAGEGIGYETAKRIIDGTASKQERYAASDVLINQELGYNAGNLSRIIAEGSSAEREAAIKAIGARELSGELTALAQKFNPAIGQETLQSVLESESWANLEKSGGSALFDLVADKIGGGADETTRDELNKAIKSQDAAKLDKIAKDAGYEDGGDLLAESGKGILSESDKKQLSAKWKSDSSFSFNYLAEKAKEVAGQKAVSALSAQTGLSREQINDLYEQAKANGLANVNYSEATGTITETKIRSLAAQYNINLSDEQIERIMDVRGFETARESAKDLASSQLAERISAKTGGTVEYEEVKTAIDNRDTEQLKDIAQQAGYAQASDMLSEASAGLVSREQAGDIIEAVKSWDEDSEGALLGVTATVASSLRDRGFEEISQSTGIPTEDVAEIYRAINNHEFDMDLVENAGLSVIESRTGIPVSLITNSGEIVDGFQRQLAGYHDMPQRLKDQFNFQNLQTGFYNFAAASVVNILVGQQLAKIDPTGGILTGFACSFLATQLSAVMMTNPLVAAGVGVVLLIISPESFSAFISATFNQIRNMIFNPLAGLSSLLGMASKPKAKVVFNRLATLSVPLSYHSNRALAGNNKIFELSEPLEESCKPDSDKCWQKHSIATQNIVMESAALMSLVSTKADQKISQMWQDLTALEIPQNKLTAHQIVSPRHFKIKPKDRSYELDGERIGAGIENLQNALATEYDGSEKDAFGKKRGLGYNLLQTNRVHIGF